tara:strand:+ start:20 stop:1234 length:1215 start_codon:yes stop_codon:yes gene_type:complete
MKKIIIITFTLFGFSTISFAQKSNVVSAAVVFKQFETESNKSFKLKKIIEAKDYIDKAFINESTSNDPKMFMYRSKIYRNIAFMYDSLDSDAIFKATDSHLKCMQPHPKKPHKIIIHQKWTKEEVLEGLLACANKLYNSGVNKYNSGEFSDALELYDKIYEILPFDEENLLKRQNITNETILYNSYFASNKLKNNKLSKEILQKLIDLNYNEPFIYISMSKIYKSEDNVEKAIEYLSLGKKMFENDQSIITEEINLFIKLGRTKELISNLSNSLESDPENEVLLSTRGAIYFNSGEYDKSINDYLTLYTIDSDNFNTNSILGNNYVAKANIIIDKRNKLSENQNNLYNKYTKEYKSLFNTALPYLESAFKVNSNDNQNSNLLKEIYAKLGMYEKIKAIESTNNK